MNQNVKRIQFPQLYFKKWNRKSYSVFNSLSKCVKICTLIVGYNLLVPPLCAKAQTDTIKIKEVEVSSSRIPGEFSEKARIISVITRDEISSLPVRSLDEVLEYALNVDVRLRGAMGIQSDISIRGGGFEQIAILLNGIRINDPQTGHHNLNIPVDISSIKSIEILQGPGTRIYGPNAFSGAINIITEAPKEKGIKIQAESGDFGLINTHAGIYFPIGKLSNVISGGYKSSTGYKHNTDFTILNAYWLGKYQMKSGNFVAQIGKNNKSFGANSFYTAKYPEQYEQTRSFLASIRYENIGKVNIRPQIYYRTHQDRFELFRGFESAPTWYTKHNHHLTHTMGAELSVWFKNKLGKTALGAEYRTEMIYSNVLGEMMTNTLPVPFEDNAVFTHSKQREISSLFIDHQFEIKNLHVAAGALAYYSKISNIQLFPGIDMVYSLNDKWNITGSYNYSFRLPSFTELYYKQTNYTPNPELKPEKAMNIDLGLKYNNKSIKSGINLFYRNINNSIDWVRLSDTVNWESKNLTEIQSLGTEVYAKVYLKEITNQKIISLISFNASYNYLEKNTNNYFSLYVLDYLSSKASCAIHHSIYKKLSAVWTVLYQQREGTYTDFITGKESQYPQFVTLDGKIQWTLKKWQIYAEASNITNQNYYDMGNISMPGRWFKMGLIFNL